MNTNINEIKGNIFDSKMQTLVNTVNTVGDMGAGLALQFKNRYDSLDHNYQISLRQNKLTTKTPTIDYVDDEHQVLDFATKADWRNPSELQYVIDGLNYLKNNYKKLNITSIAIPPLGAGLGGLKWDDVKPLIYDFAKSVDIPVEIYLPL